MEDPHPRPRTCVSTRYYGPLSPLLSRFPCPSSEARVLASDVKPARAHGLPGRFSPCPGGILSRLFALESRERFPSMCHFLAQFAMLCLLFPIYPSHNGPEKSQARHARMHSTWNLMLAHWHFQHFTSRPLTTSCVLLL